MLWKWASSAASLLDADKPYGAMMSFWDDVYALREQGMIPRVWTRTDLRPWLKSEYPNGTQALPIRHAMSEDGKVIGDIVQSGLCPEAWSLGEGKYRLVVDPDDDAESQDAERRRAITIARAARARFKLVEMDANTSDADRESYPFGLLSHDYDNPFGPMYIDVQDLSP